MRDASLRTAVDPGRRRLLRAGGAWAFAFGAFSLGGCDRVRTQTLRWAGLRVIEERDTQFGRLAVVELGRKRYLAYGQGTRFIYQWCSTWIGPTSWPRRTRG